MALRARKVSGTFEKQVPGPIKVTQGYPGFLISTPAPPPPPGWDASPWQGYPKH